MLAPVSCKIVISKEHAFAMGTLDLPLELLVDNYVLTHKDLSEKANRHGAAKSAQWA